MEMSFESVMWVFAKGLTIFATVFKGKQTKRKLDFTLQKYVTE